jgi:hypothetical protein
MSYFLCVKGSRPFAKIWKKCNEKWPKHSSKTPIILGLRPKIHLKLHQSQVMSQLKKTPITLILRNLSNIWALFEPIRPLLAPLLELRMDYCPSNLGNSISMNIPGCKYNTCNPIDAAPMILGSLSSMNKVSAA